MKVTTFTIEANDISEENRENIIKLLNDMMDNYNDVAFEPLSDGERVYAEEMEI